MASSVMYMAEDAELDRVIEALLGRHPDADLDLVKRAYKVAASAHDGQTRRSGDPYISHPLAVAQVVAEIGLDAVAVAATLLHDVPEDTDVGLDVIERDFGSEVAELVDGVTKLDRLRFDSREAQQAATFRKMLVAMAADWRVLLIKLADRLHNMRTISVMPPEHQSRVARETLEIYAPLAHRLGIQELRWQLEDLAFETLHPKRYAEIAHMVALRAPERERYLAEVIAQLHAHLDALGIKAELTGRPKHLWSIYEKMLQKGKAFEDIYDLVGIRIIVASEKDCWAALGAIHSLWSPVPGRFKDYVNSPKFNLYQSLHTTVVGPQGKFMEVQIRTVAMHRRAEYGIAAHWGYKEHASVVSPSELAWFQRIVDWHEGASDPGEFLEALKGDLSQDEVYVFTPKGKVIALPARATPIDFAYCIHTEVGHRCIGARVNGKLVPLNARLRSGDTVEIFTSKAPNAAPSRDWLRIVVTPRARTKIRQWFARERREDAIDAGKDDLAKALRREGVSMARATAANALTMTAEALGYGDIESLEAAIGQGHVSARSVAQRVVRVMKEAAGELGPEEAGTLTTSPGELTGHGGASGQWSPGTTGKPSSASRRFEAQRRAARRESTTGIEVAGMEGMLVRLARCCMPVPGDDIIGFVTRGRGISVHRRDCPNATCLGEGDKQRMVEVAWSGQPVGLFRAAVEVRAFDRPGLLAEVTKIVAEHHLDIVGSASQADRDHLTWMRFEVELADPAQVDTMLSLLHKVDGVFDAYRTLPRGT